MSQISKFYLGTGAAPIEYINVDGIHVVPDGTGGITFGPGITSRNIRITTGANTVNFDLYLPTQSGLLAWDHAAPYYDYTTTPGTISLLDSGGGYCMDTPVGFAAQSVSGIVSGHAYWVCIDVLGALSIQDVATTTHLALVDYIILGVVYRDSALPANNQYFTAYEVPPWRSTFGTLEELAYEQFYLNDGAGAVPVLVAPTGVTLTVPYTLSSCWNYLSVPACDPTITFTQLYEDAASIITTHTSSAVLAAVYNNAGVVAALPAGTFGVYALFVSWPDGNSTTPQYYATIGHLAEPSLVSAEHGIARGIYAGRGAQTVYLGLTRLGYAIVSADTGTVVEVIVDKQTKAPLEVSTQKRDAILVPTKTTNFGGLLSVNDITVQAALDTLDDLTLAETYTTDAGTAIPVANNLNVYAGQNTNTTGAGDTLRTHLNKTIHWPNTNAAGTEGVIYLGADCTTVPTTCTGGTTFLHNIGTNNTFLGAEAGNLAIPGTTTNNVGIGTNALKSVSANSNYNVAVGVNALTSLLSANYSVAVGYNALSKYDGTPGIWPGATAVGYNALANFNSAVADGSTALGRSALESATTGAYNVALGGDCLHSSTTSQYNVCAGNACLRDITTTSDRNTALGHHCAMVATSLEDNVIIGAFALDDDSTTVGTYTKSTVLGSYAGSKLQAGDYNILIGYRAGINFVDKTESSNIIIGSDAVLDDDNTIRIGTDGNAAGQQDTTYIAGIYNTTVGATYKIATIDNTHKLGGTATVPVSHGGTGATTYTANAVLIGAGAAAISSVGPGVAGEGLMGSAGAPSWTGSPSYSGTVTGGTGLTATTGNIVCTAGNVTLPATSATAGQIVLNGDRFLHAYGTSNTFVGSDAGNFSLTVISAINNSGFGSDALKSLTTGSGNSAFGHVSATACDTGSYNTCVGETCGTGIISGDANTLLGSQSGGGIVSGSYNCYIGYFSGNTNTTAAQSSNIYLQSVGAIGDSNTMRLGDNGSGNAQVDTTYVAGVYGVAVGATHQIMTIDSNHQVGTLGATASPLVWSVITSDLSPMVVNSGYICNKAGLLTVTLPSTAAVGTQLCVTGMNTDVGWRIAQGAGQQIHFGNTSTTAGAGGYLESTHKRDVVCIICVVADTEWNVLYSVGNITII